MPEAPVSDGGVQLNLASPTAIRLTTASPVTAPGPSACAVSSIGPMTFTEQLNTSQSPLPNLGRSGPQ